MLIPESQPQTRHLAPDFRATRDDQETSPVVQKDDAEVTSGTRFFLRFGFTRMLTVASHEKALK